MKWGFFILLAILTGVLIYSYASSASVSIINVQSYSGELRYVYFEMAQGSTTSTPSTNTALSPSANAGSYSIKKGASAYLWSTQFTSSLTISPITWIVIIYASCSKSSTLHLSIETTSSTGTLQSSILTNAQSSTVGTSMSEVVLSAAGSGGAVPVKGYITAIITAPATGAAFCTIYWGAGQQTDFQTSYLLTA